MSNQINRKDHRLSSDAILFILLWSAQFWSSELSGMFLPSRQVNTALIISLTRVLSFDPMASVLVITLTAYLVADLYLVGRRQYSIKLGAIWITIIAFVIVPTLAAIVYRHNDSPALYLHDGAIQIEEAMKFLLAGKNPYAENYVSTPLAQWPFYDPEVSANPALYHLIYLPGMLLISIPFYLLSQAALGWYDQRFVYLLMLIGLLPLVLLAARSPRERLGMFMVVGLNPLFTPFFIEGRNDIVVLFWLVSSIIFLQKHHLTWAGVFYALAAASKQTAWFMAPFLLLYVMQAGKPNWHWREGLRRARPLLPGLVVLIAVLLPFLWWDAGALIDDAIGYQAGLSAAGTSYPIKSLGLGGLLLGLGVFKHSTDLFPFSILQVAFGGIALLGLLVWQSRNNTLTQAVLNYAILLSVFSFFSRVFNDNHLAHVLTWLILPSFIANADVNEKKETAS